MAERIAASPLRWRGSLVGDLLMRVLDVPVIVVFYVLLRPVSEGLARTATLLNLVQTAVLVADRGQLLTPLLILGRRGHRARFLGRAAAATSRCAWRRRARGVVSLNTSFPALPICMRSLVMARRVM